MTSSCKPSSQHYQAHARSAATSIYLVLLFACPCQTHLPKLRRNTVTGTSDILHVCPKTHYATDLFCFMMTFCLGSCTRFWVQVLFPCCPVSTLLSMHANHSADSSYLFGRGELKWQGCYWYPYMNTGNVVNSMHCISSTSMLLHLCQKLSMLPRYLLAYKRMGRRCASTQYRGTDISCLQVILCTNIAETSVTVSGVRYVVDTGFVKARAYSSKAAAECLQVVPVSQAQARQRAGRAGTPLPITCPHQHVPSNAWHASLQYLHAIQLL